MNTIPEMKETTIPCEACDGGDVWSQDSNEPELVACETCRGTGEIEVELCTACGKDENGCECFEAEARRAA